MVFLDRDGVVVVPEVRDCKGYAVRRLEDLEFYPDARSSLTRLRDAGFDVVIVTNQPDVAAGLIDEAVLDAIHVEVSATLEVLRIHTCPHAASAGCACRKPQPGLLVMEAAIEPVDFERSWMVGDRDSDIAAGLAVGCRTVFIDRGWTAETGSGAGAVAWTLAEAVDTILGA